LREQLTLFWNVASDSTACRVIDSIDPAGLGRLRAAVAIARAWKLSVRPQPTSETGGQPAGPELTVFELDATLTTSHSRSEKKEEGAKNNFKGGVGHRALQC